MDLTHSDIIYLNLGPSVYHRLGVRWNPERKAYIDNLLGKLKEPIRKEVSIGLRKVRKRLKYLNQQIAAAEEQLATLRALPESFFVPETPKIIASARGTGLPDGSGIYFIWRNGAVVYVGKSACIQKRANLENHHILNPGDEISWKSCEVSELNFLECLYIGTIRPYLNFGNPKNVTLARSCCAFTNRKLLNRRYLQKLEPKKANN